MSAVDAVSRAGPPIAAVSSQSRYIIACAQAPPRRPSNIIEALGGKPSLPEAPTTDSFFARFTDGRCALRFFPGLSCAPASHAIYLASRTFIKFFTEEASLASYLPLSLLDLRQNTTSPTTARSRGAFSVHENIDLIVNLTVVNLIEAFFQNAAQ